MARKLEETLEKSGLKINMKKSEYLAAGVEEVSDLPLENGKIICGVQECKYLGVIFDKKGSSQKEIAGRIIKGRKLIQSLNSVVWDKKKKTTTKKNNIRKHSTECTHVWSRGMGRECKK